MFTRSLRLADLRGVAVHVDLTWLVAAGLVTWSFVDRFDVGLRDTSRAVTMAVAATIGFFLSILAHELGHAWQARVRDLEVRGITLFVLGGVTEMRGEATTPRHEFAVAAIGPWVSLVLAAVLGLVTAGLDEYAAWGVDLASVTGNLAWINLAIAVFNLFPAAPLDGGRVLRAAVWRLTGSRRQGIFVAALAGRVFAIVLVGLAVWSLTRGAGLFATGWLLLIALFVWVAATQEQRHAASSEVAATPGAATTEVAE